MKKQAVSLLLLLVCLVTAALISCPNYPSPGEKDKKVKDGETETWNPAVYLSADLTRDAYAVIRSKGYEIEAPDETRSSYTAAHPDVKHITQQFDSVLNKDVFAFALHLTPDDDPSGPERVDRQRNEMKSDANSPEKLKGVRGETHKFVWKFRIPSGFVASPGFTHIHQLKPVGGDEIPTITLDLRKKSNGNEVVQLVYRPPAVGDGKASSNVYLVDNIPMADFFNQWVQVEEKVLYDDPPEYSIKVTRHSDGKKLLEYTYKAANWKNTEPFIMIRPGTTFVRPKWGIYRQITTDSAGMDSIPGLKDETVLFADFEQYERIGGTP
ncbi:hypothetical protein FACS1894190_08920 [Spirochaetia bacterium]|nr:hypothetical protein FACS1894190_08920 [Spirochaetia bacterium]